MLSPPHPFEKILKIEDFIDFLYQRQANSTPNLTTSDAKLSEASFVQVWNNPEDAEYDNL